MFMALARLVVAINDDQIRTTLEMLDTELLEFGDQPTYDHRISTPTQTTEWINLTSFMARVLGHELVNITYIATYEFRDALECEHWKDMHPERLDCYVGAMAEWTKYGGRIIYKYFEEGDEDDCTWKALLYQGKAQSEDRWRSWRECLRKMGESREGARWVAERMGEIERAS